MFDVHVQCPGRFRRAPVLLQIRLQCVQQVGAVATVRAEHGGQRFLRRGRHGVDPADVCEEAVHSERLDGDDGAFVQSVDAHAQRETRLSHGRRIVLGPAADRPDAGAERVGAALLDDRREVRCEGGRFRVAAQRPQHERVALERGQLRVGDPRAHPSAQGVEQCPIHGPVTSHGDDRARDAEVEPDQQRPMPQSAQSSFDPSSRLRTR